MASLQCVGGREFRDHATPYLSGSDPVAASKHGRVIGFYIPLQVDRDEDQVRPAVAKLGQSVSLVLHETGMSDDELAEMFDLRHSAGEARRFSCARTDETTDEIPRATCSASE